MMIRVLVALRSRAQRHRVAKLVPLAGATVSRVDSADRVWDSLANQGFDLLVIGRDILEEPLAETVSALRGVPETPEIAVVQHRYDPEERARLRAAGCLAVIDLHASDTVLGEQMEALVRRRREAVLQELRIEQSGRVHTLADFVSTSSSMRRLMSLARRVAASETSLLILGETGVGKEWLARAIHQSSRRASGPFVAVNMGAIPDTLLEAEVFGFEEGAFTDARRDHRGYFELAHAGTIFLDEIAELPPHVQVKLLRVIQERKIRRVGGERQMKVDVRIMAATNQDLDHEMEAGRFRRDLYFRLGVVSLVVPPLRERREDIPGLVQSFLHQYQMQLRRSISGIEPQAMDRLVHYAWPGNIRELMNVIERAVLLCHADRIGLGDLPEVVARSPSRDFPPSGSMERAEPDRGIPEHVLTRPLREGRRDLVEGFERAYLRALLERAGGRVGVTARRAGLTPRALYEKMRRSGLAKESFKS